MTNEKLEKAIQLKEKIARLEHRLKIWSKSEKVKSINLEYLNDNYTMSSENVDENFIDFQVLKTLTVNAITKHLDEVKKEYQNL